MPKSSSPSSHSKSNKTPQIKSPSTSINFAAQKKTKKKNLVQSQFKTLIPQFVDNTSNSLPSMASSSPDRFDINEVYRRYSDIKSSNRIRRNDGAGAPKVPRESLGELCSLVDKCMISRDSETDQLINLMSQLNVKEDFSEFSNFYTFVFFICRENGQKSIPVSRAIAAWRLVLSGRFRLLNQWCDFVEKNQRHNISEDTWCQVLAFSRCVHEDLEGYDPEGAWPVLIDDFVEHMYRIIGSSCCTSRNMVCTCADPESQLFTSDDDTLLVKREKWCAEGLKSFPGLKRKLRDDNQRKDLDISGVLSLESLSLELSTKKRKQGHKLLTCEEHPPKNPSEKCVETLQLSSPMRRSMSPCAVEQCLSKGFEGLLSSHSSVQFDPENATF